MRKKRNVILAASLAAMLAVNSFSGVQFTQAKCYAAASQQSNETDAKDKETAFDSSEVAIDAAQNNEAASKYVGITNLKVSEIKNGAAQGKGDASIIYLGENEYMLVDTGEKDAFGELKSGIEESCVAQADGKYHFKAIVVTHFHSDHCGGLLELVQWEKMHIENVYIKNYSNYLNSIEAVKKSKGEATAAERRIQYAMAKPYNQYVKLVGGKTLDLDSTSGKEAIKVVKEGKKSNFKYDDITYPSLSELYANVKVNGEAVHDNTLTIIEIGLKKDEKVEVGDTTARIYGAPAQFRPKKYNDTNAENNASMIVRVVGKKQNSKGKDAKYKAIFMGDMTSD